MATRAESWIVADGFEHRRRQAHELVNGLTLRPQRDGESGDLHRRRVAGQDLGHRPAGGVGDRQLGMLLHHPLMTLHHMMLSWQMRLERFAFFRRSRQSDRSVKAE